jgi:hypothetical protein
MEFVILPPDSAFLQIHESVSGCFLFLNLSMFVCFWINIPSYIDYIDFVMLIPGKVSLSLTFLFR